MRTRPRILDAGSLLLATAMTVAAVAGLSPAYAGEAATPAGPAASRSADDRDPPVIVVDPLSFDITLPPGVVITEQLSVGNEGPPGSVLNYNIDVDDPIIPCRSIAGSTLTPSPGDYYPGTLRTYTLIAYNASEDFEWLDRVMINFIPGISVEGATDFVGGSGGDLVYNGATGDGALVMWNDTNGGWGNIYGGESATAEITLRFAGELEIPWTMSGDDYGVPPHDIPGKMILTGPTGPYLLLVAPNGGEIWAVGESKEVLWASSGDMNAVDVELSRDGGQGWETLAAGHEDTGNFTWLVTGPLSPNCLMRVSAPDSGAVDTSDDVFYIHQPVDWIELPVCQGDCEVGEHDLLDVRIDTEGLPDGDYFANIVVHSNAGADVIVPVTLHVGWTTGSGGAAPALRLERNWPNPFNPRTRIAFELPRAGSAELVVFGANGRLLRTLLAERLPAGRHEVSWDGRDDAGRDLPTGIYLYRLRAAGESRTRKMLLLE